MTVLVQFNEREAPPQLRKLYKKILAEQKKSPKKSRTAKLLSDGRSKIGKKVVEEAAEISLDYIAGDREGVIQEVADLYYNTLVLLADMDINPKEVWLEMERRDRVMGIAGKLPKRHRSKVPRH